MSKYYSSNISDNIPDGIHATYGCRQAGKTYYEFKKLKEENKELKSKLDKAIKYIGSITDVKVRYFNYREFEKKGLHISHEELKKRIKEQKLEGFFIEIDRDDILKILKGEKNDKD